MSGLGTLAPQRLDVACRALPPSVQLYCVGGAVRDLLLGEASSDRDYLVVGASPEVMLAAGFRPVGKDFPVFLHPETQAEYALARTERKSGMGYRGFIFHAGPDVSLEEDLLRRDLTVNAMAVDEAGELHDPHGGQADLQARCLRHVSPAFREDPVRLLRLARFLARWPDFSPARETRQLCQEMVEAGEANALVAERVWQELQRGLQGQAPSKMLDFLVEVGAWAAICSSQAPGAALLACLDRAAQEGLAPEARAGLLFAETDPGPLLSVLPRAVQDWMSLIQRDLVSDLIALLLDAGKDSLQAEALLDWCGQADLYRRAERLEGLLLLAQLQAPQADRAPSQHPEAPTHSAQGAHAVQFSDLATQVLKGHIEALLNLSVGPLAQAAAKAKQPVAEAVAEGRRAFLQARLAESTRNR